VNPGMFMVFISYLGEAQINGIGQNGGQQQLLVGGGLAALEMLEVPSEPGPAIHFQQQLSNFQMRQQAGCLLHQHFDLIWHSVVQRRDLETTAASNGGIWQFAGGGQSLDCCQFLFQHGKPGFQKALAVGFDGQPKLSLVALRRKSRRWQ
jgi:hypothetical protein